LGFSLRVISGRQPAHATVADLGVGNFAPGAGVDHALLSLGESSLYALGAPPLEQLESALRTLSGILSATEEDFDSTE
jgi:hypothetical protein